MIDLAEFSGLAKAQEDGISVRIQHPGTGDDLGIVIRVAGPDSERQRKARTEVSNARIAMGKKRLSAAEIEEDMRSITAASIIDWEGVIENGKEVTFGTSTAKDILARYPFILEQLAGAVGDRAFFMKA